MANSQRRIRILEEMARALYREWFVHFRFPGHERLSRVASPLGDIPQGWEVTKLGDIAEYIRRNVPKGELDHPKPYVGLEHIPRRSLALDAWDATDLGSNNGFKKGEVPWQDWPIFTKSACIRRLVLRRHHRRPRSPPRALRLRCSVRLRTMLRCRGERNRQRAKIRRELNVLRYKVVIEGKVPSNSPSIRRHHRGNRRLFSKTNLEPETCCSRGSIR
jgi:hypothetical protein